jgi:DNA-binding winged helix-turn-helix (wHTH) protein
MASKQNTANNTQQIYTFLDYEVNPNLREIHQVKTPLKISKKSFDILILLIEKQGTVVTKQEMIDRVWPNQIVTDAALNKQITRLRNDLNNHKTTGKPIIETVRGVGVRLVPIVKNKLNNSIKSNNSFIKKWLVVIPLAILALFFYLQDSNKINKQPISLKNAMVEIRSAMSINKKAFISQVKRRDELGEMLNRRFKIEEDHSWERRFFKYHDKMNAEELFIFSQIKAYTEGPLLKSNQKILDLINTKKEILEEIPSADKLRNHLIIWLNKYQKIFKGNEKMSLLYVGTEDGAPYPSEVDAQFINWLEQHNIKDNKEPITNTLTFPSSINIALVGAQNSNDWLNIGGLQYLTDQLRAHKEVQTITPKTQWTEKADSKHMSIELSQKKGIDYVLTIKNISKDQNYQADLVLRNYAGIFSKEVITAASLNLLFERIDGWVTRQLKISTDITKGEVSGYKPTEFALESYLRGREIVITKNFSQAIQLIQTAVNDDPHFFSAWLLLADLEMLSGNNVKALALIKSLENREDFDKNLLNTLYQIKASVLIGLHRVPEAKVALKKAIDLSKKQNDMLTLIDALDVKAEIELQLGPISEKVTQIYEEQLTIIEKYSPDPYKIAYAKINLSQLYFGTKRQDLAVKYSQEAYDLFNSENNFLGIFQSATLTAIIHNGIGETNKALLSLTKVKDSYQYIESYQAKASYLEAIIDSQMYLGLRIQALENIEKLKELGNSQSDYENIVIALTKSISLHILYKNFNLVQADIKQLKNILEIAEVSVSPVYQSAIGIYELYVAAHTDEPQKAKLKFEKHLKEFPDVHTMFAKETRYIKAIILSKSSFVAEAVKEFGELIEVFKIENDLSNALDIGYLLLDLQWQINKLEYVKTMNYLDELSTFKYPLYKYKARYLAFNNDFINAYVMMADLKSKANQFWTIEDQILLESYQELAQKESVK